MDRKQRRYKIALWILRIVLILVLAVGWYTKMFSLDSWIDVAITILGIATIFLVN